MNHPSIFKYQINDHVQYDDGHGIIKEQKYTFSSSYVENEKGDLIGIIQNIDKRYYYVIDNVTRLEVKLEESELDYYDNHRSTSF